MPRTMGELRRLNLEWNRLCEAALERGLRRIEIPEIGRSVSVRPRAHFQISRIEARARVVRLRAATAPFYAPDLSVPAGGLDTFGLEFEFIKRRRMVNGFSEVVSDSAIVEAVRASGIMANAERLHHVSRDYWKLTTDGSLGRGAGREFVSPVLSGEAGFDQVRKVCRTMIATGCRINRRCGLHAHIGVANHTVESVRRIVKIFMKFDAVIDGFMAPSRRRNGSQGGYCRSNYVSNRDLFNSAMTFNELRNAVGQVTESARYFKVNLTAISRHHTVEFRQHQGTVDAHKTEMWVRFLLRVSSRVKVMDDQEIDLAPQTLEGLMALVGSNQAETIYFTERTAWFARPDRTGRTNNPRRFQ